MPRLFPNDLIAYTKYIFEAIGVPEKTSELVANMLVESNLRGHDSHGVIRIDQYIKHIKKGFINPNAEPAIEVDLPSYGNINGNRAFGQVAATFAIRFAIDKAKENGFALVGCYNMAHVGRLEDYVSLAAQSDCIAIAFCNGGGPNVAAYGSKTRTFGTNPIAFAVPNKTEDNLLIGFATAATAEGKLNVARNKGDKIDEGLILDKNGFISNDPNCFYDGGAIMPMAGHKGSAFSIILEILGGIFTGGRCSSFDGYVDGNGILFMVMRPDLLRNRNDFDKDLELFQNIIKSGSPASGIESILLPGQKEKESYDKLKHDGIVLDDKSWNIISNIAKSYDVEIDLDHRSMGGALIPSKRISTGKPDVLRADGTDNISR
ncbi:MAG: Ldh family oxidoreductase [Thermodesulfobacteriota bacterium]